MADLVSQQLGKYRIVRLIGQGAFAEVYLGRHVLLNTQVAIKVLHGKLTNYELEGFLDEAHILSLLAHPHIVRVLDYDVEDGSPFLIMEYAPNGTLRMRHPDTTPVPLDTIISYVKQVASALQYAHDEKLIHRDVKPENLLVGKHHQILLSDFGFVTVSLSSRAEKVQDIAGTMAYMAPEQIQARPSRASDQYALGIVIYEWLCGQRPFDGTLEEIAAKHMSIAPPSLFERIPILSPLVEMVVMRALEKDPSRRFANVHEFAEAFEQACMIGPEAAKWRESLRGNFPPKAQIVNPEIAEPNAPTPPVIPQLNVGFTGFMNRPGIGVASDMLGFVGGGQVSGFISRTGIGVTAIKSFSYQSYPVHALALSPDGKRVAFGGWDETVYVYDITEGGKVFNYPGHTGLVRILAWSPDGKSIASTSNDKTVQVWDATTGGNVFTIRGHAESISTIAWSPDSMRIASGLSDKTVQVWEATTGNTLFTYRGHSDSVETVAWSHDGKRIASSSLDGTVQVWDTSTGSIICMYHGHFGKVKALAWSPDGAYIVSAGDGVYDSSVQVWNATTRSHILTARTHSHSMGVLILDWSIDGKRMRVGYHDGSIEELDANTGDHVFSYHTQGLSQRFVSAITWTPDGSSIAIGSDDRKVLVYDTVADSTFVCRAPTAPVEVSGTSSSMDNYNAVECITWLPDNKRISSLNSYTMHVWDVATGRHVFTWVEGSPITALAWSPDTTRIASGDPDGLLHVWDVAKRNNLLTYRGHSETVVTVAWSPDGKRIVSASLDGTLNIWDTTIGNTIFTCSSSTIHRIVNSVAWSPDSKRLVSGLGEGLVQVWDATNGNIMHTCRGHSERVNTVAWSPDGTYFASGSSDTTVQVWDAASGESVFTYHGHSNEVVDVAWSPDAKSIYSSSQDSIVQTWDAITGDNVFVHRGHTRYVKKVTASAWKADGTQFAIGSESGKLLICDAIKDTIIDCNMPSNPVRIEVVTNDEQRRNSVNQSWTFKNWGYDSDVVIYSGHRSTVRSLAWSPDSGRIVSGGHDNTVHVWDAATATLIFTYREHLDPVVTVTWSPDGKRIASASEDGAVQIWDVNTGMNVFTYPGHSARVEIVAWSPDGKCMATGGDDRTVRVWDASTGNDLYIYRKHINSVLSVAWSPDSRRIASGGPGRDDWRPVQIWDAMTGENVISCGRYPRRMYSLAWSPDGKYIASTEVSMLQVWNAATGDPVTAYQAHLNNEVFELLDVCWSPDGTRIAASDQDGKIWVGSVDLPDVPTKPSIPLILDL